MAIDDLYALPLDEFTSARNALEKQLRKDGRREEAAEVKALQKPTAPAWALNQVARANPKRVTALAKAGDAVRRGQEGLVAGGDRATLTKAVEKQRELVAQLVGEASAVAGDAGISTTAAFEDKVSNTLRAAAVDEEVAEELTDGRLSHEHEAVGLFGFGGDPPTAPAKKAKPPARDSKLTKELEAAREAEARAGRAVEAAERSRDEERDRAKRAAARLKEAEAAVKEAAKAARAATAELKRLGKKAAAAR